MPETMNTLQIWAFCKHCKCHMNKIKSLMPPDYWNFQLSPSTDQHWAASVNAIKDKVIVRGILSKITSYWLLKVYKLTEENYLVIKMKQKHKNLSTSCDASLVLMICL